LYFIYKGADVAVGRYVIMPDHMHLFAAFPMDGVTLPTWVQSLRKAIGKKVFSIICCAAVKATRRNGKYVRMNPVRAKLCGTSESWPYQGEIVRNPFD